MMVSLFQWRVELAKVFSSSVCVCNVIYLLAGTILVLVLNSGKWSFLGMN